MGRPRARKKIESIKPISPDIDEEQYKSARAERQKTIAPDPRREKQIEETVQVAQEAPKAMEPVKKVQKQLAPKSRTDAAHSSKDAKATKRVTVNVFAPANMAQRLKTEAEAMNVSIARIAKAYADAQRGDMTHAEFYKAGECPRIGADTSNLDLVAEIKVTVTMADISALRKEAKDPIGVYPEKLLFQPIYVLREE